MMSLGSAVVSCGSWLLPAPAAEKVDRTKDKEAIHKLLAAGLKASYYHDAKAWSLMLQPGREFTNVIGWTLGAAAGIPEEALKQFDPPEAIHLLDFIFGVQRRGVAPQVSIKG